MRHEKRRARQADRALDALYATLPKIQCRGKCQESCGPIMMSRREWDRIVEHYAGVAPVGETLTCPMLDGCGRCQVYAIRPMICRLWGLVRAMACPWGCQPERYLTDKEAQALLIKAEAISAREGGEP